MQTLINSGMGWFVMDI